MLVKITEEASQAGSMLAQTYPQCRTARSPLSLLKERYWMTRTASAHTSASAADSLQHSASQQHASPPLTVLPKLSHHFIK